jgi:glycyl-tRNA synthetase (class II)
MVKDEITGECFRADKLLEDVIDAFLSSPQAPLTSIEQEKHRIIQVIPNISTIYI